MDATPSFYFFIIGAGIICIWVVYPLCNFILKRIAKRNEMAEKQEEVLETGMKHESAVEYKGDESHE